MPPSSAIEREHAPDDHVRRRLVLDARLGRPVVRVGVVVARALGRRRPRRPPEEGRELREVTAIGDRLLAQAVLRRGLGEEAAVVADEPAVRLGLSGGQGQRAGALVVAIRAEVLDGPPRRRVRPAAAVGARDEVRGAAQVVRRVVRAEVGAVPEHRAVLHEAVVQEDLLTLAHVPCGVEHPATGIDDAVGRRRLGLVGAVGQEAQHEEAEQDHQRRRLHPALRDQQLAPTIRPHGPIVSAGGSSPQAGQFAPEPARRSTDAGRPQRS